VPFILNDFPHLVPETGADGAHIGQDDGPLEIARAAAGPGAIIGRSTHSLAQARAAWAEGADYLGFGPLFATPTKPDYTPIGTEDIATVFREAPVPVFCIGGIKRENLAVIVAAGARRVVVVSGILLAADVAGYIADCKAALPG
jgi:thiamine-phosphate pyrophosphorylase